MSTRIALSYVVYSYSIVLCEILDLTQQVPVSDAKAYEIASYLGGQFSDGEVDKASISVVTIALLCSTPGRGNPPLH